MIRISRSSDLARWWGLGSDGRNTANLPVLLTSSWASVVCRLVASAQSTPAQERWLHLQLRGPFLVHTGLGLCQSTESKAFPFSCLIPKKKKEPQYNRHLFCATLPAQSIHSPVTTCWHEVLKQLRKQFGNIQRGLSATGEGVPGFSLLGSALSLKPGLHSVGCRRGRVNCSAESRCRER